MTNLQCQIKNAPRLLPGRGALVVPPGFAAMPRRPHRAR